jgi:DNA polymerase-3 subunit gamma/tau
MSQALYRKWRPARFDQIVGQEHITQTLQNSVAAGRVGHAYLFCGPRGTGKTTMARLLAKAVNCLHEEQAQRPCDQCAVCQTVSEGRFLDLIEIDAASNTGVDDIRDLRDKINFAPNLGRYKVYIIDEVHMLSTAAFNALLKTLEEPPAHAIFVLATTEEHKVPLTIKSRCQQFNFRLLTVVEISKRLQWLAEKESLTIEPGALDLIARQGAGSLRDAESLLDQLVVAPGDTITLERAQMVLGTAANSSVLALTDAWLNASGAEGLGIIHEALVSGADARQFCRQMVNHLRTLLLLQAAGLELAVDVPDEHKGAMLAQAQRAPRQDLIKAIKRFQEAALKPIASWQPQLPLELAFMELLPETPLAVYAAVDVREEGEPAHVEEAAPTTPVPDPPKRETAADRSPMIPEEESGSSKEASVESMVVETEDAVVAADPAVSITLNSVKAQWRTMVAKVGQVEKNLPALLAMCKPLAVEGNVIILGFDFPIFKEKFDRTEHASGIIEDTLSELIGTKCGVRCVVTSDYVLPIGREEFQELAQELGGILEEES